MSPEQQVTPEEKLLRVIQGGNDDAQTDAPSPDPQQQAEPPTVAATTPKPVATAKPEPTPSPDPKPVSTQTPKLAPPTPDTVPETFDNAPVTIAPAEIGMQEEDPIVPPVQQRRIRIASGMSLKLVNTGLGAMLTILVACLALQLHSAGAGTLDPVDPGTIVQHANEITAMDPEQEFVELAAKRDIFLEFTGIKQPTNNIAAIPEEIDQYIKRLRLEGVSIHSDNPTTSFAVITDTEANETHYPRVGSSISLTPDIAVILRKIGQRTVTLRFGNRDISLTGK